jgi:UrcA family protein
MSVMRRTANKFVIPCTVFAMLVLLSPLGSSAATATRAHYEGPTQTVNYADLDLTNSKAVATLYRRIKLAAGKVCESSEPTSLQTLRYVRMCTKQAIAQAVKDVDSSGLTTVHLATANQMAFR